MTGERDFIGQLEAYLHEYEGATPLPNAVRDALHAELPRISQVRRWRLPEYRYLGLAAAVVLLAVVGLYLALAGPPPGNPGPTPTHIASESPTTPVVEGERTELRVGSVYDATAFSEPLRFITPTFDPTVDQGDGVVAVAQPLGSTAGVLMIEYGCCWVTWLLDDQPVRADVCDASAGTLPDIPATPEDVGAWLRSSSTLVVADPVETPVDGRTALRFDITPPTDGCQVGAVEGGLLGEGSYPLTTRVFAVPTGDDTILYVTWSDPGSLAYVEQGADELIRSMTFE